MARPFAAPPTVFNAGISGRRNIAYAELDLEDIKRVKSRSGIKVNDVVMALWEMADEFAVVMEELLAITA